MADTDEDSKAPIESDVYLTEHLAAHISATHHHLTGAPDPPEKPYAPSFHPPTGHWSSTEKALFFRALSAHSRLRPDLIAASIATKSIADVAVYISLLREGGASSTDAIARDLHPAAHEVSPELVALEDRLAARICPAEPAREWEIENKARKKAVRAARNAHGGDGQRERNDEAFELWHEKQEVEWAREDVLGRLDVVGLQVLDRILRLDEETTGGAGSGDNDDDEGDEKEEGVYHALPAPGPSTPPVAPTFDDDIENDDDDDASNLSPASRRRVHKRLYMRRKRAEASGFAMQLDPARLKPGRKASATSKYRPPPRGGSSDSDIQNPKRRVRGETRPYKIQHELERLGIGADYLRSNGLDLFHLGALGRLMRLYPRLDDSRPEVVVAESIAASTIQMLHALVVQFTRGIVRRAITLRELDFALLAHTKVWRLGERVVRPPHVRRALELSASSGHKGGRLLLSRHAHFEALVGMFSEGEESDSDDDVPLALLWRRRKGKATVVRDEDEERDEDSDSEGDEDPCEGEGEQYQQQQQQQAGPSKGAAQRRSPPHHAIYSPFVYAPDLIAPAHPFGVYAPGTTPHSTQSQRDTSPRSRLLPFPTSAADWDDDVNEDLDLEEDDNDEDNEDNEDEVLAAEMRAEARLDAVDARADAAYEAGVWHELRGMGMGMGASANGETRRLRKRRAEGYGGGGGGDGDGDDASQHTARLRKRRKDARGGLAFADEGPELGLELGARAAGIMLRSPDGVKVKSTAVIEESGSDSGGGKSYQ